MTVSLFRTLTLSGVGVPTSTPSTSVKETLNTSFSSATPLTNMVSSLRRFSKGLDSQAQTGTTLHLSTHSSWHPPKSGLAQFTVTVMPMPMPMLMTMPQALMHPLIVTEFLLPLWGAYRFFFSLYVSFIRGACHSQPLFATRTRVLKPASLR
jgi:hypothetical protein